MNKQTVGTLEEILQVCFGCNQPFNLYGEQTVSGIEAYEKLITVIYGLENIGVISNAHNIIKQLDEIANNEESEEMVVFKKCKMMMRMADIKVGDQIEIPLKDMGTFTATAQQITDDGILFMFDDCVTRRSMNSDCTNQGDYEKSELCKWIENDLFEAFPDHLKSKMSNLTLPTYGQMFGHDDWYEQVIKPDNDEQLPLMKIRKNRVMNFENDCTSYWVKNATKKFYSSGCFASVSCFADAGWGLANDGHGVRPVFLIG